MKSLKCSRYLPFVHYGFGSYHKLKLQKAIVEKRPYEILLFSPLKPAIKVDETTKSQLRPKMMLDFMIKYYESFQIGNMVEMINNLQKHPIISDYSIYIMLRKISDQVTVDEKQFNKLNKSMLSDKYLRNIRNIFEKIQVIFFSSLSQITSLYILKILSIGEPINNTDFQAAIQYLLSKGYYTNSYLQKYMNNIQQIPKFDFNLKKDNIQENIQAFEKIVYRIRSFTELEKYSKLKLVKQIQFKLYEDYINNYLEFISDQKILYFLNQNQNTIPIFITHFLYADRIVPKVKQTYLKIFKIILNDKKGGIYRYGILQDHICQVIAKMYSLSQRKQIYQILKLYENNLIIKCQKEINLKIISELFFQFGYNSKYVFSLLKMPKSIEKEENVRYTDPRRTVSFTQFVYGYTFLNKVMGSNEQKKKQFIEIYEKLFDSIQSRDIFDEVQSFFEKNLLRQPQRTDKYSFLMGPDVQKIAKNLALELKKNSLNYKQNILQIGGLSIKLNQKDIYAPMCEFSVQIGIVRLSYFIEASVEYIKCVEKFSIKNPLQILTKTREILTFIQNNLCFPGILKNIILLFELAEKYNQPFKQNRSIADLYRVVDNARNTFSKCFNLLEPITVLPVPNLYSLAASSLKIYPYNYGQCTFNHTLDDTNVKLNLLHDIYGKLKFYQSNLKIKLQNQIQSFKSSHQSEFSLIKITKNYLQYPHFADFFIRKKNKFHAFILYENCSNQDRFIESSIQYFKKLNFKVLVIHNQAQISKSLECLLE